MRLKIHQNSVPVLFLYPAKRIKKDHVFHFFNRNLTRWWWSPFSKGTPAWGSGWNHGTFDKQRRQRLSKECSKILCDNYLRSYLATWFYNMAAGMVLRTRIHQTKKHHMPTGHASLLHFPSVTVEAPNVQVKAWACQPAVMKVCGKLDRLPGVLLLTLRMLGKWRVILWPVPGSIRKQPVASTVSS